MHIGEVVLTIKKELPYIEKFVEEPDGDGYDERAYKAQFRILQTIIENVFPDNEEREAIERFCELMKSMLSEKQ